MSTQQHTAQVSSAHALLGRFETDEKQQYVMNQIRVVAGDAATGLGSPVVHDQPESKQPETKSAALQVATLMRAAASGRHIRQSILPGVSLSYQ